MSNGSPSGKRKHSGQNSTAVPSTSKRAKSSSKSKQAKVQSLEQSLLDADTASLNPLLDLVQLAQKSASNDDEAETTHAAIWSLYRVVTALVKRGMLYGRDSDAEKTKKEVRVWLYARLDEFVSLLGTLLSSSEDALRDSALQITFALLKELSGSLSDAGGTPQLHPFTWRTLVHNLLESGIDASQYLKFDDIRWFFLRDIATIMSAKNEETNAKMARSAFKVLETVDSIPQSSKELSFFLPAFSKLPPKSALAAAQAAESSESSQVEEDGDDWRTFFDKQDETEKEDLGHGLGRAGKLGTHARIHAAPQAHRTVLVNAWLALLPQMAAAGESDAANVLSVLHVRLFPHLRKEEAVKTMDWIAGCVDYGDATGLLALNTLFELMTRMNLDYPDLYVRLYAYLDRNVLHLKHRARFLRVLERMLSSTHLPAVLIASFLKRLARLSLSAPPAAIVAILPLTYNLLKRHPSCMLLIQRDFEEGKDIDPYDATEKSPFLSGALDSSLWELASHTSHFHAPTATLARILSEPFNKPNYAMEDFLDHSYSTMFDAETGGKRGTVIKHAPAVRDEGDSTDVVTEIWVC